jgi:uncharacterized RDD family membrane protein YckC
MYALATRWFKGRRLLARHGADSFSAMSWESPTAAPPDQAAGSRRGHTPSGWWSRVGAVIVDALVLIVVWVPIAILLPSDGGDLSGGGVAVVAALYVLAFLYAPLMLAFNNGQTVGKAALSIRVIKYDDGAPIGLGRALLREIPVKAILGIIPLIDVLWPLWQKENRALHDLVVDTWVVKT